MEFLVEFELNVPDGIPESEVQRRVNAEAAASAALARTGYLERLWRPPAAPGERKAIGLYRAESQPELDGLLVGLPLSPWMRVSVTLLEQHPNDPKYPKEAQHVSYHRETSRGGSAGRYAG